ncbi:hypothetical protein TNCV_393301 [Trichonephila clavipes]|nr:hypothetical protein TNCV_393301 [Trichonephila clavipes]
MNARVQPTASSATIQTHVAPLLGAPVSSRTIRRRLAEGHLGHGTHYRPSGERLNPAFALQRQTTPTAGVMLRLRAKTAWLLAACHNGQPDCTLTAAVRPFFPFSARPEENLKHTKKTEQTRTIRQIHRDLTYHNSAELNSFSIM